MQRLRNELKFLIEHKADLNRPAEHRAFSPPHFVSFCSDDVSEIAGMLIDAGADIKSRSSQGETALHLAASLNGNRHLLKKLIASGAEINSTDYENETPLHKAAYWGNHFAARHLMLHGADLNFKNVDGMTPLHLTVFFCQTHLMQLLVESGSDKNIKKNNKEIPLDIAENYILPDENARGIMISLLSEEKTPPMR